MKYFRRNFLPGRRFRDDLDFRDQLEEWTATIADVRVHGTTHERPLDRFAREREVLTPTPPNRAFRLEAMMTRIVATDYLVSVDTNRHSVPWTLIGQTVEVRRQAGQLTFRHRGTVVATHAELPGPHQLRIQPEHGPGPIARTARQRPSTPSGLLCPTTLPEVEVRDLNTYEALCQPGGGQ